MDADSGESTVGWTIRPILAADAGRLLPLQRQVQALHAAAHPELFRGDAEDAELLNHLRESLGKPEAIGLAAVDLDGTVLGYAILEIEQLERTALRHALIRGHLREIVVDEGRRREGIGSALVAVVMASLLDAGVERVAVSWFAFNAASAALMRRAGFNPLHVRAEAATTSPPPPPSP